MSWSLMGFSLPISMLHRRSRQFYFVPADVATEEGCSNLASEADRLMGCVDGLVSIASTTKLFSVFLRLRRCLRQSGYRFERAQSSALMFCESRLQGPEIAPTKEQLFFHHERFGRVALPLSDRESQKTQGRSPPLRRSEWIRCLRVSTFHDTSR